VLDLSGTPTSPWHPPVAVAAGSGSSVRFADLLTAASALGAHAGSFRELHRHG
jgi:hypothetical protein